jgi:hypothetical protein
MRSLLLLLCMSAAACASSNTVGQASPSVETVRMQSGGGTLTMATVHEAAANGGAVPFALDPTWLALRAVYDSLGIAITTIDSKNHVMGNPNVKLRRRLGNVALSKYINCGNTQGAPSADTYEIILSVLTTLRREGEGTMILTTVEGQGRPITISGDYTRCSSTSALEARIVDMVNAALKH